MTKSFKAVVNLWLLIIAAMLIVTPNVFATTTAATVTKKVINTKTLGTDDVAQLNTVKLTETTGPGFLTAGKYFTVKIPLDVKLCANAGSAQSPSSPLTYTSTMLGSSASPHNLYVGRGNGSSASIFLYQTSSGSGVGGSQLSILTLYNGHIGGGGSSYKFGAVAGSQHPVVATWGTFGLHSSGSLAGGSAKVGQVYYDATDGVVLTLAAKGIDTTSYLEQLWLNKLTVYPAAANTTGTVTLTTSDGDAAGADDLGVSAHSIDVATLVTQAVAITGASSGTTPPVIPAGKVAGQPMGRLNIAFVGDVTSNDNVITVTLDNGAKFHTGASSSTQLGSSSGAQAISIPVAGTNWSNWNSTSKGLTVNASGQLVITLGSANISDTGYLLIPRTTTAKVIDTSGVTASGDITATISATGDNLAEITGSAVVASVQLTGAGVTFTDDTTAGLTTLYTGRTGVSIGSSEKITISETAPTSLLSGGTVAFALSSGAKFNTGTTLTALESTATGYTDTSLAIDSVSIGAASATGTTTVTAASSGTAGIYHFTGAAYNLSGATAGSLQATVSGTAGAAGTITIATLLDATATAIASPIMVIPGQTVSIPDIVITESKVGALVASKIGLKFPAGFTLSASSATVTATKGGTSTSIGTLAVGTTDESYAHFDVSTQSSTGTGVYVITISGLTATTTTGISQGTANVIVGGAADATWASTSATFGSNAGAKPTKQTVKFGDVVSPTVPFISTAAPVGTVITQTFIPAGNDIGKVGDLYVFTLTPAQYYSGGAWSATATPYAAAGTLGSTPVVYDISAVAASTKIYVGYGTGVTGTESTMNTNGTFVLAYTTAAAPAIVPVVIPATAGAAVTATINTTDTYTLNLATTNAAGATPTAEYVVYQVIVSGTPSGWWFMTPTGSVQYVPGLDPTTVTYDTAAAGSISLGDFLLGTYLPTAGDQLILVYAYATGTVDFTDPTSFEVENVVTMTVQ